MHMLNQGILGNSNKNFRKSGHDAGIWKRCLLALSTPSYTNTNFALTGITISQALAPFPRPNPQLLSSVRLVWHSLPFPSQPTVSFLGRKRSATPVRQHRSLANCSISWFIECESESARWHGYKSRSRCTHTWQDLAVVLVPQAGCLLARERRDGTDKSHAQDARTLSRTWCSLASPRVFPSFSPAAVAQSARDSQQAQRDQQVFPSRCFLATHDITDVVYKYSSNYVHVATIFSYIVLYRCGLRSPFSLHASSPGLSPTHVIYTFAASKHSAKLRTYMNLQCLPKAIQFVAGVLLPLHDETRLFRLHFVRISCHLYVACNAFFTDMYG